MKQLVFATNNKYKATEVEALLDGIYQVLTLKDIGCDTDIPETGNSFAENAAMKSHFVLNNYQLSCFADDSGLEVPALNNEPGIYSARYSGQRDDLANMNLLLQKMEGKQEREARFKTVICFSQEGQDCFFEGVIEGVLTEAPMGDKGFGYDPIFIPNGYDKTFAQMSAAEKNAISHRAIATNKLIAFLKEQSS